MRVNDPNLNPAQLNPSGAAATGKTAQLDPLRISTGSPAAEKAGGAKSDSVQISTLSSKINELQSGSVEREAYLERLGASVADGSYNADAEGTSTKLVDEMLAPKADENVR
jgi:anti-sigma28 factor (negative regulator of flagellin synthesis)